MKINKHTHFEAAVACPSENTPKDGSPGTWIDCKELCAHGSGALRKKADTMKTTLRISLLALAYLSAAALHSSAAELEPIVRSRLTLLAAPAMPLPSTKTAERRSLSVKIRSLLSGAAARLQVEVTTYWFAVGADGGPRTVLAINRSSCGTTTGQMNVPNQDSGPQKVRIEGWVVTVRDGQSKELLAVKGSTAVFETLARTKGALPDQPGPVKETP